MDAATKKLLDQGERMTELLKQSRERILKLSEQVALLEALRIDALQSIPTARVIRFSRQLLEWLWSNHSQIMTAIDQGKELPEDLSQPLEQAIVAFAKNWEA